MPPKPATESGVPGRLSNDFALTVDSQRHTRGDFKTTSETLDFHHPSLNLHVRVVHTDHPDLGVHRKHLEISGSGKLTEVRLEEWIVTGARGATGLMEHHQIGMGPIGLGQPIFWNGFFLGVEHPGAENWITPTTATCRFPCSRILTDSPWISPPCTLGAGHPGAEWPAFMDYIHRLRPHREPPFVTLINNWYQFGRARYRGDAKPPGSSVLDEMRAFAEKIRQFNLPLDFYCLDDPWTDTPHSELPTPERWPVRSARGLPGIWNRISPDLFPSGLPSLNDAASPMDIGLWCGPIGGYLGRQPLVEFGKSLGYESFTDTTDDSGFGQTKLCCHGPRYHTHLRECLSHWSRAGVRYWKFDGVEFHCNDASHGHPVGPTARTEQMDSWIDILRAIRAEAPDAVIAFTTGSNPSPWWLQHVDFVWRGGHDDRTTNTDAPKRERFATYIDACLRVVSQTSMPLASVAVFGLIQNAALHYASEHETPDDFERALWLMVGRGSHHHDLYVSPDSLNDDAWSRLARVLRWARAKRHLLARTRMILGNPESGEIYGFASWRDGRGLLTLRNPASAVQRLTANLSALLPDADLPPGATLPIVSAYGPAPDATAASVDVPLALLLPPYGVAVWELGSR